jgi:hypothetical protein
MQIERIRSPWPPRGGTGGIEQQGAIGACGIRRKQKEEERSGAGGMFWDFWLDGVAWKDVVGPACGTVARYIWMDPHGGMVASQRVYIFIMKFGK